MKAIWLLLSLWRDFFMNWLGASPLIPHPVRPFLYRIYGIQVGRKCRITHGAALIGQARKAVLGFGERCFVNYGCVFDTSAPIRIGRDCWLGTQIVFVTSSHEIGHPSQRAGSKTSGPIIVEDGCWIGARVTILAGVTVGKGTVVGAGSVVITDCEPNGLYCGNPARLVRMLPSVADAQELHPIVSAVGNSEAELAT